MYGHRVLGVLALVLAVSAVGCDDDDETGPRAETFRATLTGQAERPLPPTPSSATGTSTLTLSANGDTVTYAVAVTGLSVPAAAAHIHGPAGPEDPAGIVVGFANVQPLASGTIASGSFTASTNAAVPFDSVVTLMRTGLAYVNVHTATYPAGEVRGQIVR